MAGARQVAALFFTLPAVVLTGCDVVQGFRRSGDALFPPVKTYLDVPGYRVAEGSYRSLDMVTSSQPYVLARSATSGDDTLFVMHYHEPKPCRVPDVARYWTDAGTEAERTYLAYFTASDGDTLRFSDMDCTPYDLTLATSSLPVAYSPTGLVIRVGSELLDVDPSLGETRVIASDVEDVDAGRRLVRAGGRLGVFDGDWKLVEWLGDGVTGSASAFGSLYFQDETGIVRLTLADTDGMRTATTSSVALGACGLTVIPETAHVQLLAFHQPCDAPELTLYDAHDKKLVPFDVPVDRRFFKIQAPLAHGSRPDLTEDPYYVLYLANIDEATSTGQLVVRSSGGEELVIGEHAALERSELTSETSGADFTGGFALLDVTGETGRFVRFDLDGESHEISANVIRRPAENAWSRLVIDRDGTLADLAEVVDGEAVVVAHDVPRRRYAYLQARSDDPLPGFMAWYHDVEGDTGTLSLASRSKSGPLDDQGHQPLYVSAPVARNVFMSSHGFMNDLPGFIYFTNWNYTTATGRLEYANVELGFSAVVSEGIADYVQPGSGLLYAVPYGEAAGIWLARGK